MTLTREQLGVPIGAIALDVGCASGEVTAGLALSGCRAIGLELEEHLLKQLRASALAARVPAIRGDATLLPLPDDSIDAACAIEVLEHISDTQLIVRELRRVLRPGGSLCVCGSHCIHRANLRQVASPVSHQC